MRIYTCRACGLQHEHHGARGRMPTLCRECKTVYSTRQAHREPHTTVGTESAGYRLALAVTDLRLAVEQARAALRMGYPRLALEVLERCDAPSRQTALPDAA